MIRETVAAKAARYLTEARLTVLRVDGDQVTATCRGSGELYQLGHDRGRGWWCSCPSRTDQCSHLVALRAVTVRTTPRPAGRGRTPIEEGRRA
jgi:uncharacterized Zn finger protein